MNQDELKRSKLKIALNKTHKKVVSTTVHNTNRENEPFFKGFPDLGSTEASRIGYDILKLQLPHIRDPKKLITMSDRYKFKSLKGQYKKEDEILSTMYTIDEKEWSDFKYPSGNSPKSRELSNKIIGRLYVLGKLGRISVRDVNELKDLKQQYYEEEQRISNSKLQIAM